MKEILKRIPKPYLVFWLNRGRRKNDAHFRERVRKFVQTSDITVKALMNSNSVNRHDFQTI